MGIYYNASNETKKQWLNPARVGGGGIKARAIYGGEFANLLVSMMMFSWYGDQVQINADDVDHHLEVKETYEDVTEDAVRRYNASLLDGDKLIQYRSSDEG